MKRGEILLNLFAITIVATFSYVIWNVITTQPIQTAMYSDWISWSLILVPIGVIILMVVFALSARERQCPKCEMYFYSLLPKRTCPNCGASVRVVEKQQ